ncbi:MAG: nucleotidyltransferase domain-containing protein [Desulfohalobiaceae bacterium]|nr:nucleotidyltransferase domain-containing protein [Desulfohalobiaceae bacterium]
MQTTKPTLWLQVREKKQQESERLRREALDQVDAALQKLAKRYSCTEIYLFGSVLQPGKFDKDSDIDVAVAGLPKQDLYRLTAELMSLLGRNVDLVILEKTRFSEKIKREGLLWGPGKK